MLLATSCFNVRSNVLTLISVASPNLTTLKPPLARWTLRVDLSISAPGLCLGEQDPDSVGFGGAFGDGSCAGNGSSLSAIFRGKSKSKMLGSGDRSIRCDAALSSLKKIKTGLIFYSKTKVLLWILAQMALG